MRSVYNGKLLSRFLTTSRGEETFAVTDLPVSPTPNLRCSECGAEVPGSADLSAALSPEELAALPSHLRTRARVLCSSCASAGDPRLSPDTAQNPRSRYFQVTLTVQEAQDPDSDPLVWETVGGFSLRAPAETVTQFVNEQSEEFGKRMQLLLDFADQ